MLKVDEINDLRSCWNKARPKEPMFILLGRDVDAPGAIENWCDRRVKSGKNEFGDEQIQEALIIAKDMRRYNANIVESSKRV